MKFSLSKTKYSRGGAIYLKYIAVIFAFIQCCCASLKDVPVNTEEQLNHLTLILETRFHVSSKTFTRPGHKCAEWIQQDLYKDSIFVVIPKAIADCALKSNEYKEEKIDNGVIKFDGTIPADYVPENWNAVVLYNLIYFAFQYKQKGINVENSDDVINKFYDEYIVNKKIEQIYGIACRGDLERAFDDIKQYSHELDLINYIINNKDFNELYETRQSCENYNENGRARVTINPFKLYNKELLYKIDGAISYNDIGGIAIEIEKNKITHILLYDKRAIYYGTLDQYMNIIYEKIYQNYLASRIDNAAKLRYYEAQYFYDKINDTETNQELLKYGTKLNHYGIDIGWYKDRNEHVHLAWITEDDLYLAQSYIMPTDITICIDSDNPDYRCFEKIYLDKGCINYLTIKDICKNRLKKIYLTSEIEIMPPHDCKHLVSNSNSLIRFDIPLKFIADKYDDYGQELPGTQLVEAMFTDNQNLEYVAPMELRTPLKESEIFVNNPKLQRVKITDNFPIE